jgi:hypothetical protein
MVDCELKKLTKIYPPQLVGFGIKANGVPRAMNPAVSELILFLVNGGNEKY